MYPILAPIFLTLLTFYHDEGMKGGDLRVICDLRDFRHQ